jgi:hypothetical protein
VYIQNASLITPKKDTYRTQHIFDYSSSKTHIEQRASVMTPYHTRIYIVQFIYYIIVQFVSYIIQYNQLIQE